jgi:hypothetical protein
MFKPYRLTLAPFVLFLSAFLSAAAATNTAAPKIVFVGDQVTANWPLTQTNPNWINKGQAGAFSWDVVASFEANVVSLHPNIVHILVGLADQENDIGDAAPAEITPGLLANLQTMVQEAKAANIQVILGLEPDGQTPTNAVVAAFGAQNGIPVISYANVDGATPTGNCQTLCPVPTAAGYQQMTALLENVLPTVNLTLGGGYLQNSEWGLGAAEASNVNTVSTGVFLQFTAVGWYNDGSVHSQLNTNLFGATGTWTSSNPLVLTLDQTGYGQALTAGTTIVRYTSLNGVAFSEWIMYIHQGT